MTRLASCNQQITEELLTINNSAENGLAKRSEMHFDMANKVVMETLQSDLMISQVTFDY